MYAVNLFSYQMLQSLILHGSWNVLEREDSSIISRNLKPSPKNWRLQSFEIYMYTDRLPCPSRSHTSLIPLSVDISRNVYTLISRKNAQNALVCEWVPYEYDPANFPPDFSSHWTLV